MWRTLSSFRLCLCLSIFLSFYVDLNQLSDFNAVEFRIYLQTFNKQAWIFSLEATFYVSV